MILGRGGAGKSTLARRLGEVTGLPVAEMDTLFWQAGLTAADPSEWTDLILISSTMVGLMMMCPRPDRLMEGGRDGRLSVAVAVTVCVSLYRPVAKKIVSGLAMTCPSAGQRECRSLYFGAVQVTPRAALAL